MATIHGNASSKLGNQKQKKHQSILSGLSLRAFTTGFSYHKMVWAEIIEELRNGKNAILKTFYLQHAEYCIQKLTKKNRCPIEDAEDIFVDALINLREKLISGKVTAIANVRSYLYKTCDNMFLARLAHSKRAKRNLNELERFYYNSVFNQDELPFDVELMEITMAAWSKLSERCKDILHYFYIDKLKMREISEVLGLSNADVAKTTKSRCYRKLVEIANELLIKKLSNK